MGDEVMTQLQAWAAYDRWLHDPRAEFVDEPPELEPRFWALTRRRQPATKDWADSFLAAFATVGHMTLATFDRGLGNKAPSAYCLGRPTLRFPGETTEGRPHLPNRGGPSRDGDANSGSMGSRRTWRSSEAIRFWPCGCSRISCPPSVGGSKPGHFMVCGLHASWTDSADGSSCRMMGEQSGAVVQT